MMECVLEYIDVRVARQDGQPILEGVSFSVQKGERIAILGLNGAGKTTLLHATVGLLLHNGEIRVLGERVEGRNLNRIRSSIGFLFNVPDDQLLFPQVIDDVAFGPIRGNRSTKQAMELAQETLANVGIAHLANRDPHKLSHGEKVRVALAGAIANGPPILLLDEPSAGLDPPSRRKLAQTLSEFPGTIVTTTHDLDFAGWFCSRFALLASGRLALDCGSIEEVLARWKEDCSL